MLEDLRKKATVQGGFWLPNAGDEILVHVEGEEEVGPGISWACTNLVDNSSIYIPQYGYLKKDNRVEIGKTYYLRCTSAKEYTSGIAKGKIGRVFYVQEIDPDHVDTLVNEMRENSDSAEVDSKIPF